MGIFSRMRDIISSNINAMLDRAEDPEKLIRLMIQEMEDTLVEIKASCAGAMAAAKKVERELDAVRTKSDMWGDKAAFAVEKGRDDLARDALREKKRYDGRIDFLEEELRQCHSVVDRYQSDILQLEEKLASVREKQRVLVQRHIHAKNQKRAQTDMRRADSSDVLIRFSQFENRVERMEAEAELVNLGHKPADLDDEFSRLEQDDDIERELMELKTRRGSDKETAV
ncbi:phage shock protein PspA [Dethiosulfatarculus sandiegensis]|uniref:Phage-shock protein n=1 Tax=Dethiosulfatarculus sandiegensis TaxID=1429043 RepID=A0A0D2IYM2_9BACT|nr:phage shock protein PspA [Dethiosulfatarculus sandiegensis]KIX11119.1 phage-shock protein [Dethiosulfatarculus sandiegensis]